MIYNDYFIVTQCKQSIKLEGLCLENVFVFIITFILFKNLTIILQKV